MPIHPFRRCRYYGIGKLSFPGKLILKGESNYESCLFEYIIGRRTGICKQTQFGANDRRRMQDIPVLLTERVECLGKAISGDPAAYLIRGAVTALRSEDAAKIAGRQDMTARRR